MCSLIDESAKIIYFPKVNKFNAYKKKSAITLYLNVKFLKYNRHKEKYTHLKDTHLHTSLWGK